LYQGYFESLVLKRSPCLAGSFGISRRTCGPCLTGGYSIHETFGGNGPDEVWRGLSTIGWLMDWGWLIQTAMPKKYSEQSCTYLVKNDRCRCIGCKPLGRQFLTLLAGKTRKN